MAISSRGNALLSVLIGASLLSITVMVMSSVLDNFSRSNRSLSQKLEILQVQQTLLGDLADSTVCGCNFDPTKVFDSTNLAAAQVQLDKVYGSCAGGTPGSPSVTANTAYSSYLNVDKITLKNITSRGSPGAFQGTLEVNFKFREGEMSRHPAAVKLNFQADVAANPTAARITGCAAGPVNGGGGGSGGYSNCQLSVNLSCPAPKVSKQCLAVAPEQPYVPISGYIYRSPLMVGTVECTPNFFNPRTTTCSCKLSQTVRLPTAFTTDRLDGISLCCDP